jgi:hypothetical protein
LAKRNFSPATKLNRTSKFWATVGGFDRSLTGCGAANRMRRTRSRRRRPRGGCFCRIASPEMFPEAEMLPHLICSRPMFIGGANDEADQHGGT